MIKALIDSSFLYILLNSKHKDHQRLKNIAKRIPQLIVPYVVLTEVAYLFNRDGGIPALRQFVQTLKFTPFTYEILIEADFLRIENILAQYADAKFDFVDCCLMALAERHHISIVCTLDQRDFAIFRPAHLDHLELLP